MWNQNVNGADCNYYHTGKDFDQLLGKRTDAINTDFYEIQHGYQPVPFNTNNIYLAGGNLVNAPLSYPYSSIQNNGWNGYMNSLAENKQVNTSIASIWQNQCKTNSMAEREAKSHCSVNSEPNKSQKMDKDPNSLVTNSTRSTKAANAIPNFNDDDEAKFDSAQAILSFSNQISHLLRYKSCEVADISINTDGLMRNQRTIHDNDNHLHQQMNPYRSTHNQHLTNHSNDKVHQCHQQVGWHGSQGSNNPHNNRYIHTVADPGMNNAQVWQRTSTNSIKCGQHRMTNFARPYRSQNQWLSHNGTNHGFNAFNNEPLPYEPSNSNIPDFSMEQGNSVNKHSEFATPNQHNVLLPFVNKIVPHEKGATPIASYEPYQGSVKRYDYGDDLLQSSLGQVESAPPNGSLAGPSYPVHYDTYPKRQFQAQQQAFAQLQTALARPEQLSRECNSFMEGLVGPVPQMNLSPLDATALYGTQAVSNETNQRKKKTVVEQIAERVMKRLVRMVCDEVDEISSKQSVAVSTEDDVDMEFARCSALFVKWAPYFVVKEK